MSFLTSWYHNLKFREPYTASAETISQPERINWDYHCELLVAGFGGAGAAAALEAHEQGLDVLVMDRFSGGGATTISGGIYYAGGGTKIQQQLDIQDSADNMFNYLKQEVQGAVSDETLHTFCDNSVDNFDWIQSHGVPFDASFCPFKTSYPPDHYFFYYSGNESFPPYSDHATPAARGHRGHRKGISGAAIFEPLRESVKRNKVRVKTQLKLTGLCVDDQGEVIGVNALEVGDKPFWHLVHKALFKLQHIMRYTALYIPVVFQMIAALSERVERKQGRAIKIRATQGVVLSTGGFFANQTMVKEHAPKYLGGSPLGTMTDDGCGITMAMGLGAKTGLMNSVSAWRFVNPPQGLARGVMVGPSGERVCNEMYYGAQVGEQIMANHNGKAWVIIDAQTRRQAFKDLSLKKGLWFHVLLGYFYLLLESKKANSIVELGRKIGADVENLNKTVAAYNALAASDDADPMGKPKEFVNAIENGPFYAIDISYDSSFVACPSLSLGGLVVEESSGLVKREDGSVIKGLYAAGRTAVGIPSRGYVSGLSIADCVFSGRRASRHAAQLKQELKVATSTT